MGEMDFSSVSHSTLYDLVDFTYSPFGSLCEACPSLILCFYYSTYSVVCQEGIPTFLKVFQVTRRREALPTTLLHFPYLVHTV